MGLEGKTEKPRPITEPNILLVEGADAYWFCTWACQAFRLTSFQIIDFGGVTQLRKQLELLKLSTGFEQNAKTIIVVRDAETCARDAVESVRSALEQQGFVAPDKPFEVAVGEYNTALVLFPGFDESGKLIPNGTLEDLCLTTIRDHTALECVDSFLLCCEEIGSDMRYRHKMRLYAYLTAHHNYVGMKIGEAARANAWDWDHPRMKPLKSLLTGL